MSEKPEAFIYADMLEVSVARYSAQGVNWREASRLGDLLEELAKLCNAPSNGWQLKAADELRRQHAEIERLTADNERLREALRTALDASWNGPMPDYARDEATAALQEVPR